MGNAPSASSSTPRVPSLARSRTLWSAPSHEAQYQMQLPKPLNPQAHPSQAGGKKPISGINAAWIRAQMRSQMNAQALRQRPEGECHLQDRASRKLCAPPASHQQLFTCSSMEVDIVPRLLSTFTQQDPQVFGRSLGEVLPLLELSATSVSFSGSVVRWMDAFRGRAKTVSRVLYDARAFEMVPQACLIGELGRSLEGTSSNHFGFVSVPKHIAFE